MSRLLALAAVAVIALACAPRPATVVPAELPIEENESDLADPGIERQDPGLNGLSLDLEHDWQFILERMDRQALEEAITADHLGPPSIPDPEGFRAPEEVFAERFPVRPPHWNRRRLLEGGLNAECNRAIALGVFWLARQQHRQDSSWAFDQGEITDRVAATGFVLLTLLAIDETHKRSDGAKTSLQWKVAAGIDFLLKQCQLAGPQAGRFENTTMTGQAVATLALCEAYTATRDPVLKPYAQAAINFLQKSQAANGGWRDTPDDACDIAVVAWVVEALHAARLSKELVVDDRVIKKAINFLDLLSAGSRKSMYGAFDNSTAKAGTPATATGLLCRYFIDAWGPSHVGMIDGVGSLMKNPPSEANRDPLYLYYATHVLWRYGDEDWKTWNEGPKQDDGTRKGGLRDVLVRSQNRKDGVMLGSWDPVGGIGTRYGRLGTTALTVLTLEVYYRAPSVYKHNNPETTIRGGK